MDTVSNAAMRGQLYASTELWVLLPSLKISLLTWEFPPQIGGYTNHDYVIKWDLLTPWLKFSAILSLAGEFVCAKQ